VADGISQRPGAVDISGAGDGPGNLYPRFITTGKPYENGDLMVINP